MYNSFENNGFKEVTCPLVLLLACLRVRLGKRRTHTATHSSRSFRLHTQFQNELNSPSKKLNGCQYVASNSAFISLQKL